MSKRSAQNLHEEAYMRLMKGLSKLDLRGSSVPSDLLLIGDHAFPLAMNSQGQVLMAASQYGRGRIVVLGHESYLTAFPVLVENALTWLRGEGSDNLSVGVNKKVNAVADNLSNSSFQAEVVKAFNSQLKVGVYVTNAYDVSGDGKELVRFMKAGGGLLIAGQAWSWAEEHPEENSLVLFEGNKVSSVAGIYFSEHRGEPESLIVSPEIPSSWMSVGIGKNFEEDLEFLLKGVTEFDFQEGILASEMLVHGSLTFPIGTTDDGKVFLAGAYYGQGRVIVVTHEALLSHEEMAPFWINAIRWLDQGRKGVVGSVPASPMPILRKSGLRCENTYFKEDLSVYVCTAYGEEYLRKVPEFVAEGGGLLMGGHAWWWALSNKLENPLKDFPGNKILNKMGLSVLPSTMSGVSHKAPIPRQVVEDQYHFRHHLRVFAEHVANGESLTDKETQSLKKLGQDCSSFLRMDSHESSSYAQVLSILTDIMKKAGMPQVSESRPVKSPKDHLLLSVGAGVYRFCRDPDAILPYLIKDIPLLPVVSDSKIKINVKTAGGEELISTGLYLSPGMKTSILVPEEIVYEGWKIQIGCQSDHLSHEVLKRAPDVTERFPVDSEKIQVKNLWGGLIYLLVPAKTRVDGVEITVKKAVLAPYYKSGVTTIDEWAKLRTAPPPWAELEFDNIILTIPSDVIRKLERPDELAVFWNDIMKGVADLAVIPQKLPRKERFVTDLQISHGWMHAGYPIMAHKASANVLVDIKQIKKIGLWGPIHELGHNQQRSCWEFPSHTTECTCNLWSVYVHEEVLGIKRAEAHSALTVANRDRREAKYIKGGANLSSWSVWVALETYLQLQEKFGWAAIKKVFAAYHDMSNFPSNNQGKMNLYAETFSKAVGMNLSGFFKAWGWPIEGATEENLVNMPPWNDHPLV